MDDVNRWDFDLRDGLRIVDNGDWVRHDDHEYAMGKAAAALAEAQAEIARLREELGAFLGVWAVEYAKRMGFAEGELHPQHYDRMAELGLRVVDFRRAALEAKTPAKG